MSGYANLPSLTFADHKSVVKRDATLTFVERGGQDRDKTHSKNSRIRDVFDIDASVRKVIKDDQ
jgi:hypothetical protein